MTYDDFTALNVRIDQQIAWVTLDHPPINLVDLQLISSSTGSAGPSPTTQRSASSYSTPPIPSSSPRTPT